MKMSLSGPIKNRFRENIIFPYYSDDALRDLVRLGLLDPEDVEEFGEAADMRIEAGEE
jgi:hypothetical protein